MHQTNVTDQDDTIDDRRSEFVETPVVGMGQRVGSEAVASGQYEVPGSYRTGCVKNDGLTDCDGTEGPGESGTIYTTPMDYQIIDGGTARAIAGITVDRGVVRADAIAASGGPVVLSTPAPRPYADVLYGRHVHNKEARAQLGADVLTRTTVHGPSGTVGHVTFVGVVEGTISGNGDRHHEPYDLDPTNFYIDGRAGARFIFSATSWVNGYVCGSIVNGCPGKNVEFKFGAETTTGPANNTENGGYVRPFSLTVDVIDGFVLQTRIVFDGYAVNHSSAQFGNTARIDTITVSEGFDLDLGEGDLARNGDTYAFLPTLPAESTTTTTTPFGTTTTTMSSGTTTTTTLPDCAAAAGLAAARCRLDAVLARPLCGDPLPKGVEQRVRAPLRKAVAALQRAIDAPTAKQPRFVRRALAALDRTNAVVAKAVAAKRAPRAMPAACGQAINAATSQARATIP